MAMINCGECGREVSDKAFVCPHCGRDVRALKASGARCRTCSNYWGCDFEYGPDGYVCLKWSYDDDDGD